MDWPSRLRRAGITLLHIDAVKQGVKCSVLLLLLLLLSHSSVSGTDCSPLPCKTNMRCSRCLEINRRGPLASGFFFFVLLCVAMGREEEERLHSGVRMRGDAAACVGRKAIPASVYRLSTRTSAAPRAIPGTGFVGGGGVTWRCIYDKYL